MCIGMCKLLRIFSIVFVCESLIFIGVCGYTEVAPPIRVEQSGPQVFGDT